MPRLAALRPGALLRSGLSGAMRRLGWGRRSSASRPSGRLIVRRYRVGCCGTAAAT